MEFFQQLTKLLSAMQCLTFWTTVYNQKAIQFLRQSKESDIIWPNLVSILFPTPAFNINNIFFRQLQSNVQQKHQRHIANMLELHQQYIKLHHDLYGSISCYISHWPKSMGKRRQQKFLPLLFFLFLVPSSRAQVAPVDRSAPNLACRPKCGFGHGCAFWGSRWWSITFRGSDPQNQNFVGVNRHFKPNLQKKTNRRYLQNYTSD